MNASPIKRAIISVSDKTGLLSFASALVEQGIDIYSTGGTGRHLSENGLKVHDISAYTGFPEMMDGRLKTLHPKVFGGILARRQRADDLAGLVEHGIESFELVVVNLYPFESTVARAGVTETEAIEQIDIGGPSLVRAAAKNFAWVTIATSPDDYREILTEVAAHGATTLATRRKLAGNAFRRTAAYDAAITDYFQRDSENFQRGSEYPAEVDEASDDFPNEIRCQWQKQASLRYGENPHQRAAVYRNASQPTPNLLTATQLHGKELSYNNYLDLDAALNIVRGFERPTVSVIKHNNPCGVACADTIAAAASAALAGDPLSAFGSILASNRTVDQSMADLLATPGLFVEALIAPDFSPAAIEILTTKPKWKNNVRLLELGTVSTSARRQQLRPIDGGVLLQDADVEADLTETWKVVTEQQPDDQQVSELRFAWQLVRHVKSNAIVLTRNQSLVGNGAGQMSRVDAVEIAIRKAGDRCQGSVMASDAFFPFPDSIQHAASAGVVALIQPGGSKNDHQVIAACNEHGLPMVFTGRRHFKH